MRPSPPPVEPPVPVLTEEVAGMGPTAQEWLLRELPRVLGEALTELQPQLEQQLLDALMPRLLASLARAQAGSTSEVLEGRSRLP